MDEITIDIVLDTVEVTVDVQGPDTIHTHLAVDVTDFQANVSLNTDVAASKVKTDHLTVTQAVDLDQMETDVAANNAKVGVTNEEANPDVVPQAEAEAGVATTERIWTAERVAQAITALGGSGSGSLEQEIAQVAHGLSAGEAIRHNGTIWVKAQADSVANAGAVGVVKEVVDVDNFVYSSGGLMTTGSWTDGAAYFLSPTVAGAIITEPTWELGQVKVFMGTGTPTGLEINIDIGYVFSAASPVGGYTGSFTSQTSLAINHKLNTLNPIVQIYDNSGDEISPSNMNVTDADNLSIDFGGVSTTGRYIIAGGAVENDYNKHIETFTSQTSVTVTHNLGTTSPVITIWDDSNIKIEASSVTVVDEDSLTVVFGSAKSGRIAVGGGYKAAVGVPSGGTAGQVLTKNSATDYDTSFQDSSPLTTKGDLFGYDTDVARIPVGTNDQVLTADSTQALGVKWADAAGGGGNSTLVIKPTDETRVSTTTLADDTDLIATLDANSTYFIYARVIFTSNTTPDFKYTFTAPPDASYGFFEGQRSVAQAYGTSRGVTVGSAFPRNHFIYCWVETVTGGSFAFQWAQNTSSTIATTVEKGSYLEIFKVL